MFLLLFLILSHATYSCFYLVRATASKGEKEAIVHDGNLRIENIYSGLEYPASMAFLGKDDFLAIEKDKGTVQRIVNGEILDRPVLDVDVSNQNERGMLGIAISKHKTGSQTYVYLYFTESPNEDGTDNCPKIVYCEGENDPMGNRLYKYELISNKLVNPELLLNLPATPGSDHNGGSLAIGPDNNIYLVIGTLL